MSSATPGTIIFLAWFCVGPAAVDMEKAIGREDAKAVKHLLYSRHTKCVDLRRAPMKVQAKILEKTSEQIHSNRAWPFKATFFKVKIVTTGKVVTYWTIRRLHREV